jgi:hypothetical protein
MARRADLDVLDVVIASEAKQSIAWTGRHGLLVALLLAMTTKTS